MNEDIMVVNVLKIIGQHWHKKLVFTAKDRFACSILFHVLRFVGHISTFCLPVWPISSHSFRGITVEHSVPCFHVCSHFARYTLKPHLVNNGWQTLLIETS